MPGLHIDAELSSVVTKATEAILPDVMDAFMFGKRPGSEVKLSVKQESGGKCLRKEAFAMLRVGSVIARVRIDIVAAQDPAIFDANDNG